MRQQPRGKLLFIHDTMGRRNRSQGRATLSFAPSDLDLIVNLKNVTAVAPVWQSGRWISTCGVCGTPG